MEIGLDSIEIINSIPSEESQTAIHVYNHIDDIRTAWEDPPWMVRLHRIEDSKTLFALLADLAQGADQTGSCPLVHLECHGWDDAIELASGERVMWQDLSPALRRLNRATRNNLALVCAACKGFHSIKTIIEAITEGTAVRVVIGPAESVASGVLEGAIKALYSSLLADPDLLGAVESARAVDPTMSIYRAEDAFISAYMNVLAIEAESGKSRRQQVEEWVSKAKELPELRNVPRLHDKVRQTLKVNTPEVLFAHIKRNFFMLDEFPELESQVGHITLEYISSLGVCRNEKSSNVESIAYKHLRS